MTRELYVRREVRRDIAEADAWYRQVPLIGDDFLAAIHEAIALIREYPLGFPITYRSLRRTLLRRFPYSMFYRSGESQIIVFGVLNQAQDLERARSSSLARSAAASQAFVARDFFLQLQLK
jgi:plasmid stabilization system protein ParE